MSQGNGKAECEKSLGRVSTGVQLSKSKESVPTMVPQSVSGSLDKSFVTPGETPMERSERLRAGHPPPVGGRGIARSAPEAEDIVAARHPCRHVDDFLLIETGVLGTMAYSSTGSGWQLKPHAFS